MQKRILIHGFVNFAFALLILSTDSFILETVGLMGLAINFIHMHRIGR